MRKVEYWIVACGRCPFYEEFREECFCNEPTIGHKRFDYPGETFWFPEWCPLEKGKGEKP